MNESTNSIQIKSICQFKTFKKKRVISIDGSKTKIKTLISSTKAVRLILIWNGVEINNISCLHTFTGLGLLNAAQVEKQDKIKAKIKSVFDVFQ